MGNYLTNLVYSYDFEDEIVLQMSELEQNIININILLEHLNNKGTIISEKINYIEKKADKIIDKTNVDKLTSTTINQDYYNNTNKYTRTDYINKLEQTNQSKLEWDNYDIRLNKDSILLDEI